MTSVQAPIESYSMTPEDLRSIYSRFPTGVVSVAAHIGGTDVGLAASSFVSVSLAPALVAFFIRAESKTWPILRSAKRLGISVLAHQQNDVVARLSGGSSDRCSGVQMTENESGALFVKGASAWLNTALADEIPAGDHKMVLLRVHSAETPTQSTPIVFHDSKLCYVGNYI